MSTQFTSLEGALREAGLSQTSLINSVLHLFTDALTPNPSTPLADYTAAEADYDGYAAQTIAAWLDPILAQSAGYQITSPTKQFSWAHVAADVGNMIRGCYLVDATGKHRATIIFTQDIPMQGPGQGFPISMILVFPAVPVTV